MKGFVCKVCDYISLKGEAPHSCPVCGSPQTSFKREDDAIKIPQDPNNLNELEKKHVPVISLVKKCSFIQEECQDVHVKMGQIQHPMKPEHYIMHIDFYINKEFISRVKLTPDKLNPAAALHIKAEGGKLTVVELCNLHGAWISEVNL
ncbi:MAG: hypothetical protein JSV34_02560 [Candidatus Omnitrophota bacterium]|nr:MAG: hypothetical protein JSV34_02560 [Candidatus Omnitrophota bacterium]